jgi:hypothetical protein
MIIIVIALLMAVFSLWPTSALSMSATSFQTLFLQDSFLEWEGGRFFFLTFVWREKSLPLPDKSASTTRLGRKPETALMRASACECRERPRAKASARVLFPGTLLQAATKTSQRGGSPTETPRRQPGRFSRTESSNEVEACSCCLERFFPLRSWFWARGRGFGRRAPWFLFRS